MLVFPLAAPRHISAAFQERFSALLHGEYAQSRFWKYFTFWDCFLLDDDLPSKRTRDNTFLPLAPSPLSMHCAMFMSVSRKLNQQRVCTCLPSEINHYSDTINISSPDLSNV